MSMLKSMATVSGFTLLSRVLGLVREILIGRYLGTGGTADAFVAAFRFPNMFRRIFGEGAFNAAYVPLFARELEEHGEDAARQFASRAFTILALILGVGTLIAIPLMPAIMWVFAHGFVKDPAKFDTTVALARIMFSYLLCMALSAHLSGTLNTIKVFAMPAFAPVLLNILFITALLVVVPAFGLIGQFHEIGLVISWAVFAAGFAQLFALYITCWRKGIHVRPVAPAITPRIRRLGILMVPGILAAGIQQLNLLVGTVIASVQEGALSYLYYSDRIYQLPLGMIGIAFGIVLLPDIARRLRGGDESGAVRSISRGMEFAMLLTLPAAVAMIAIPVPIIATIFERGEFTSDGTKQTAAALAGFALGLPGYVLIKVLQPGYFAREDTKRPMIMAAITVAVNIAVSLALFPVYGHVGIAAATAISAWVNVVLLVRGLRGFWRLDGALLAKIMRMLTASMTMGIALWSLHGMIDHWFDGGFLWKVIGLALLVGSGVAVYFAAAIAMKATSLRELKAGFRRG
jgi:putative peptidoglycan lipid II flippase